MGHMRRFGASDEEKSNDVHQTAKSSDLHDRILVLNLASNSIDNLYSARKAFNSHCPSHLSLDVVVVCLHKHRKHMSSLSHNEGFSKSDNELERSLRLLFQLI